MLWLAVALSAPVSLSFGPAPLAELDPILEKLTGERVEIDAALRREVVVVEATDVGLDDLKSKIAAVVCGRWESRDGVSRLRLDTEAEVQRRTENDEKVGHMFREVRRNFVNSVRAEALKWTVDESVAQWAEEEKIGRAMWSPVERAVGEAIGGLSDAEFGALFRQVRFVYSEAARPGIARWDEEARQKTAQGTAEETSLMKRLVQRGVEISETRSVFNPYNSPISAPPKGRSWTVLIGSNHNPYAPPTSSHGREFKFQAFHLDADGRILGDSLIQIPGLRWFNFKSAAINFEPGKLAGSEKPFLAKTPEGQEAEPLARFVGDGFRRMARDLGRDLCLCLPDSYHPDSDLPLSHAQALLDLAEEPVSISDQGGWLSGGPFDPVWSRTNRMDRRMLAAYVDECLTGEILTVRERLQKPNSLRVWCADWRTGLASHVLKSRAMSRASDVVLGRLTDSTISNLAQGQALQFGNLPKVDREAIWTTACEASAYVHWELDGAIRNRIQGMEVVFGWPNGVPSSARVRLVLDAPKSSQDTRIGRLEIVEGRSKLSFTIAFPKPQAG